MIFKTCKKEDLPVIREVLADSFSNYFFPMNPSVEELNDRFEALRIDYGNSLIMYEDNEPIGIAICAVDGDTTHLGPMGIALKHQGRGCGKELLNRLISLHKENNFKNILLEVICENKKAYSLYQGAGFKVTRKLRGFKGFAKKISFDPAIKIEKKSPDEILEYFNLLHKGGKPAWQNSFECLKKTKCDFGFMAFAEEEALGYFLLKETRIADIAVKKGALSFDAFKALISAGFAISSFMFIFDLPEEDICVKFFESTGFEVFFDQYEMIFNLK